MLQIVKTIGKMFITILLISITPFILPLLLKLFIYMKIFESVDEFKNIINIFYNVFPIIYIFIMIVILLWFFYKWEDVKKAFRELKIKFQYRGLELSKESALDEVRENEEKNEIIQNLKPKNKQKDSNISKNEIQKILFSKEDKKEALSCNNDELEQENKNLKFYAAYNIINVETKQLLHIIYNEKYIESERFKNTIIKGYTKRNKKNVKFSKRDINQIAQSKYKTILEGLKFLNIIEPSEDDKDIKLTSEGREFVEKYIEGGAS